MLIYAGIDEAGYGPLFGPLTVGRCVIRIPRAASPGAGRPGGRGAGGGGDDGLPDLWARLNKAVSRTLTGRRGRLVVADSKKLKTRAAGIAHLETGCLAFAGLWDHGAEDTEKAGQTAGAEAEDAKPQAADETGGELDVAGWLDRLGEVSHRGLAEVPWYGVEQAGPWAALPVAADAGELAVARGMLRQTACRIGVEIADLGCAVVFEDRFNAMVAATRSKAAVNFTCIGRPPAARLAALPPPRSGGCGRSPVGADAVP